MSFCWSGGTFASFLYVSMRTLPVKFGGTPKVSGSRKSVPWGGSGRPPVEQPGSFAALFRPGLYGSHAISLSVLLLRYVMPTHAVTVSLRFSMAKRPIESFCAPSRLAMSGRYILLDPEATVVVSPSTMNSPLRRTSLAWSATTGWSLSTRAEPL